MQGCVIKSIVFGTLCGSMLLSLGGCSTKIAKLEPAEETIRVEDTARAGIASQTSAPVQVESVAIAEETEEAGPNEALDTAPSGQADSTAGMVKGSRTTIGLFPVYFDFDRSMLRPDQLERLAANGRFLKDNPGVKVRVEGNSDERGTNEYNLTLGEKRAASAKKYLVNLGVATTRLSIVSYGEERPLQTGSDEIAWAENRRSDFVVIN